METWQLLLVIASGLAFLVLLVMFIWFIFGLLIFNFVMLNLDTVFTNQPARLAFTSAQAIGWRKNTTAVNITNRLITNSTMIDEKPKGHDDAPAPLRLGAIATGGYHTTSVWECG
ncbi:hypothetical protein F5Y12DRAFT_713825 [Xylaria sp. FL1777]|nr:hypothetical protein F5Y12DRAFT_713825 [Xylaria sp. FL1777]